jgi:hypothetical protein
MILDFLMPSKKDSERISGIDTAWLRMERPTNLMMITGVMIFDQPLAYARLKEVVESRFLKYRRFTQRMNRQQTCDRFCFTRALVVDNFIG